MKNLMFPRLVGTLALILGLGSASVPAALARASAPVRFSGAQQQTQQQATQKFQGTIVKVKGKYILQDKASGATYQLDNQDKAKEFAGKDVQVSGTLDPSTNTIEVADIEAQGAQ
ncbi:MAG TPA: DUF5818 domain-containing protein [Candidatus Acidoferrales bacterium]|nr:DUF5818 domain-containing protein [Candidatus Acidoferrales bacterium]